MPSHVLVVSILVFACAAQPRDQRPQPPRRDLATQIDAIGTAALADIVGLTIAVSRRNEPVIVRAFGMADREHGTRNTSATPFRIASSSKQFVAYAILQLVEKRMLDLDEDVATYLPDLPRRSHPVTLRRLLSHTSGVPEHTDDPATEKTFASYRGTPIPLDATIALFESRPLDFVPGTRWSYSNSGYVLLVKVIETVTKMPYVAYLEKHVFQPLQLANTRDCDVSAAPSNLTRAYVGTAGKPIAAAPHAPGSMAGGGFVCSTAGDLVIWQRALHRSSFGHSMSTSTTLNDGTSVPYGFAVSIAEIDGHRLLAHGGADASIRASVSYFPDDDLVVIVLANTGSDAAFEVAHRVVRAALDLPEPVLRDLPLDDKVRDVAGSYEVAKGWTWSFTVGSSGLLALSGDGEPLRLSYQGNGVFLASSTPALRFAFAARTVTIDQFGMRFLGTRQSR